MRNRPLNTVINKLTVLINIYVALLLPFLLVLRRVYVQSSPPFPLPVTFPRSILGLAV